MSIIGHVFHDNHEPSTGKSFISIELVSLTLWGGLFIERARLVTRPSYEDGDYIVFLCDEMWRGRTWTRDGLFWWSGPEISEVRRARWRNGTWLSSSSADMLPVLNPKGYGGARVLEASSRPIVEEDGDGAS